MGFYDVVDMVIGDKLNTVREYDFFSIDDYVEGVAEVRKIVLREEEVFELVGEFDCTVRARVLVSTDTDGNNGLVEVSVWDLDTGTVAYANGFEVLEGYNEYRVALTEDLDVYVRLWST